MNYQSSLAQRIGLLAIYALILSTLSSCASEYVHKYYGVTAYEGFNEPRRILVSRKTRTVAIDADAFYFKPREENLFYNNIVQPQSRTAQAKRPMVRRFIVTDAANIARQIKDDLESGKKWPHRTGEAPDEVDIPVYKVPAGVSFKPWHVIPEAFNAPPATDAQLASRLPDGYDEYLWGTRVPWIADDGKTYKLEFIIMDPSGCRFERTPISKATVPILAPVAFVIDFATAPIQAVGIFAMIAIYGL